MLLQSIDYLELFRRHGCTLQIGGSDQWGNITAGLDLIRRVERGIGARAELCRWSPPRPARSSASRPAAAACGWTPRMTSPYAFFQYWINVDDRGRRPLPAVLHVPCRTRRSRRSSATPRNARPPARPHAGSPRRSPRWCTASGETRRGDRRERGAVRPGRASRARRRHADRRADRGAARRGRRPAAERDRPARRRPAWSPAGPPPGARSTRAAPT